MLLFLVRHAHAEPGAPDELRPLSARGQDEAAALGARLAAHPMPPRLVLSSPLVRSRETAGAIGEALGVEVRVDDRLAPGATSEGLRELLAGLEGPVAVVAHQPDCSELALELTGRDPGFPPAGAAEIVVAT